MAAKSYVYDLFKLIVTIILIILLFLVIQNKPKATITEESGKVQVEVTQQPPVQEITTPTIESAPVAAPSCPKATTPRISGIGAKVEVVNELIPLRSSPKVAVTNILQALPIGTELEITALPVCANYLSGANLWWGVQTTDGKNGWAAEGSAISPTYYLEELK